MLSRGKISLMAAVMVEVEVAEEEVGAAVVEAVTRNARIPSPLQEASRHILRKASTVMEEMITMVEAEARER
jgi:division protein CdvB (Snf7/Vps24/ESCRT-III family)